MKWSDRPTKTTRSSATAKGTARPSCLCREGQLPNFIPSSPCTLINYLVSRAVSKLLLIIGQISASDRRSLHFKALAGCDPLRYSTEFGSFDHVWCQLGQSGWRFIHMSATQDTHLRVNCNTSSIVVVVVVVVVVGLAKFCKTDARSQTRRWQIMITGYNKTLLMRWDSERELSLQRSYTHYKIQ